MEQLLKTKPSGAELKKAENELALKEFGQELKRIRRVKQLTQKQLTEVTGIDDTVISDLENGNYTPSLVIIRQLAEGLNVSPYELIAPYYGIPVPDFNARGTQALDKIREVISSYYHLESEPIVPEENQPAQLPISRRPHPLSDQDKGRLNDINKGRRARAKDKLQENQSPNNSEDLNN